MAAPDIYNATLIDRIDLTEKLAIFRVRPDATRGKEKDGVIPDFEAGQYVSPGLEEAPPSLFFEQYDNEPLLDIQNREAVEKLIASLPQNL